MITNDALSADYGNGGGPDPIDVLLIVMCLALVGYTLWRFFG